VKGGPTADLGPFAVIEENALFDCWTRFGWARKQKNSLKRAFDEIFASSEAPRVTTETYVNRDHNVIAFVVGEIVNFPSRDWGLIVGDIANNYRSVLEMLVYETAFVDTGGADNEGTQFPLCDRLSYFKTQRIQGHIRLLTKEHRALIARYQPYHRWDGERPHPASVLRDLTNDNKHRAIQPVLGRTRQLRGRIVAEPKDCVIKGSRTPRVAPLYERGTVIGVIPIRITGPEPHVDMQFEGAIEVALRNGLSIEGTLDRIDKYVFSVLKAFGPVFETAKAKRLRNKPRGGRFPSPVNDLARYFPGYDNL
jgi:hypothetical protein